MAFGAPPLRRWGLQAVGLDAAGEAAVAAGGPGGAGVGEASAGGAADEDVVSDPERLADVAVPGCHAPQCTPPPGGLSSVSCNQRKWGTMTTISAVALAAALAAAPGAPASKRQNALSFENGAMLVQDGGSYGSGATGWTAWNLTDGDEQEGWCSPEHRPVGSTFVWELDTSWRLDALAPRRATSRRKGTRGSAPGRWTSSWTRGPGSRRSGRFSVGKLERREWRLPCGRTVQPSRSATLPAWGGSRPPRVSTPPAR